MYIPACSNYVTSEYLFYRAVGLSHSEYVGYSQKVLKVSTNFKNQSEIHPGRFPVGFCCFFIDGQQSNIFKIIFSLKLVIFRTEFLIFGSL